MKNHPRIGLGLKIAGYVVLPRSPIVAYHLSRKYLESRQRRLTDADERAEAASYGWPAIAYNQISYGKLEERL